MDPQTILDSMNKSCEIDVVTQVKLTGGKKNEQQGRITKKSTGIKCKFVTSGEYQRIMKEKVDPDFVVKDRKWGKRQDNGLIEHNGGFYAEVHVESGGNVTYLLDNVEIDKGDVIGLPPSRPSAAEDQGVIVRTYKLDNIVKVY